MAGGTIWLLLLVARVCSVGSSAGGRDGFWRGVREHFHFNHLCDAADTLVLSLIVPAKFLCTHIIIKCHSVYRCQVDLFWGGAISTKSRRRPRPGGEAPPTRTCAPVA